MPSRVAARGNDRIENLHEKNSRRIFDNEVNDTLRKVMSGTFTVDRWSPRSSFVQKTSVNERRFENPPGGLPPPPQILALLIKLAAQPLPALPFPLPPPSSSSLYVNLLRGCILFFARVLSALPPFSPLPQLVAGPLSPLGVLRIPLY